MSVSEGLKKIVYKSFHVTLKKIDIYGNISNPPQSLSHKIKIQPWTRVKDLKSIIASVIGINLKSIRLFYQNIELLDELTMFDYKIIENKKPEISYQIQNKRTQTERVKAEEQRAAAEQAKAVADKAYMREMQFTTAEYLKLREIEIEKEKVDMVKDKNQVNVTMLMGGGATPIYSVK